MKKNFIVTLALLALPALIAGLPGPVQGGQPVTIRAGTAAQHAVAISFDDGPSSKYTLKILALLRQYQAHATFFVIGRKVEKRPWLVQAMLREGHEVGNHTYGHPYLTKVGQEDREREIEETDLDLDLAGCPKKQRLLRPPYSEYDDRLVSYLTHTGRRLALWSLDSGDWKGLDKETIVHNVLDRVKNGAIIIFHEGDALKVRANRDATVEALKIILPALKERGYRMLSISELLAEK